MKQHKHAALIHAWAEGAEIQFRNSDGGWTDNQTPSWEKGKEYRIKPGELQWFENIPEHGVLCWVWDDDEESDRKLIRVVYSYHRDTASNYGFETDDECYRYAKPLTNDELEGFRR